MFTVQTVLTGIALGAVYGGEAAIMNYLTAEDLPVSWSSLLTAKFWENFSWTKFGKTILVGMMVGAVTNGYGFITASQWASFTAQTGIPAIPLPLIINFMSTLVVTGVDRLAKTLVRRTPLVHGWNGIKSRILKLLGDLDKVKQAAAAAEPKQ
jgi:hypothetical protein